MMTQVKSENASTLVLRLVMRVLSNNSYNAVNNFLSETFTSLFTAVGFNYSTVMRYDYVGTSMPYSGLFPVVHLLINLLSN